MGCRGKSLLLLSSAFQNAIVYSFNGVCADPPALRIYTVRPGRFWRFHPWTGWKSVVPAPETVISAVPTYRSRAPTFICSAYSSAGPEEAGVIDLAPAPVGACSSDMPRVLFLCLMRPCRVSRVLRSVPGLLSLSSLFMLCLRISFSLYERLWPLFCFPSLRLTVSIACSPPSVRAT